MDDMKHNKFSFFDRSPNTMLWYISVTGYAKGHSDIEK